MWYTLTKSPKADPDFAQSATELLQSTSRNLILITGGAYLLWQILASGDQPAEYGLRISAIALPILLTAFLSLRLLRKHLVVAQAVWQVGMAGAITLAVYVFRRPEIAFFYALLPLMAVVTVGWPAGLLAECLIIGLVVWLSRSAGMPSLPSSYGPGIVIGGVLTGVLGWGSARTLLTAIEWHLFSLSQAQENMESARRHRAQLARVLKDLDQAYYRLQRANAALVAAQKKAEEAERFKAEFVAHVSHELRTPLNLIVGFSEMMMTSPESYGGVQVPGPYRSDLNSIYHSAQHLLALVDDVLDLARIDVGKIPLARDQVDLAALVEAATAMVSDYVVAKGLDLQVDVEQDLPPIWVDRLRIRQVLLNLLVNAARFTEYGSIRVHIARQDDQVVVRVTDTGRGIPSQDLPRIFEEFHVADDALATWHSGTGLGLPISKKFVELHGGRMGVESVYLQGSSFWFALPLASAQATGPRLSSIDRPMRDLRRAPERIIVVVHDDLQVAPLLQRYLDGYQVLGVTAMEEGVALAEEVKAIALVTDVTRETPASLENVLVVSCPLPDSRRAAAALGAWDILVKPVSRRELLAAVERLGQPVGRVLIADDDPELVRLFRRILRTLVPAPECLEAYNGQEALDLIERERPDLVLLDLAMPEMDGRDVLGRMATDLDLAGIPAIVISARIQDYVRIEVPGPIRVSRLEAFRLGDVVRALGVVLSALAPGWRQSAPTEPEPAGGPAGSPAWPDRPLPPASAPVGAP
jgi:signal transduction histidine kinase/CheY-like chemotaxis protein